jgi:hypothetical protein
MDMDNELDGATREDLIRRAWYIHDARWFALVTAEFGMAAANRINRQAVRAVAEAETGRLVRALGQPEIESLEQALWVIDRGRDVYVAEPLMEMEYRKIDDRSYEVALRNCFVSTNVAKAGIADRYECAVFDRLFGWHKALGWPLSEQSIPTTTCAKARGEECRRVLTLAEES